LGKKSFRFISLTLGECFFCARPWVIFWPKEEFSLFLSHEFQFRKRKTGSSFFSVTEVQLSEFIVPEDDFGETSIETNHVSIFR
jgi:hypothetical protein